MAEFQLPPIAGTNQQFSAPSDLPTQDLKDLTLEELYSLRHRIDMRLPQQSLKSINMEQELVTQLNIVKTLQQETLTDPDIPANQRSQVAGAVASSLQALSKLQIELYDSERMKMLEQVLIDCIKSLPMDTQETFLNQYESRLGASE
jgi:hypothetical protein